MRKNKIHICFWNVFPFFDIQLTIVWIFLSLYQPCIYSLKRKRLTSMLIGNCYYNNCILNSKLSFFLLHHFSEILCTFLVCGLNGILSATYFPYFFQTPYKQCKQQMQLKKKNEQKTIIRGKKTEKLQLTIAIIKN